MIGSILGVFVLVACSLAAFVFFTEGRGAVLLSSISNNDIPDQRGKIHIVTGANVGLGLATCEQLVRHGAICIATARTQQKADEVANKINSLGYRGKAVGMELELADHKSIEKFNKDFRSKSFPSLDSLILNAGFHGSFQRTKDGLEMIMGVNFMGHYYLNILLQDVLEAQQQARVVIVSSSGYWALNPQFPESRHSTIQMTDEQAAAFHDPMHQYGLSKLFNIYHMQEMSERMQAKGKTNVVFTAAHPGIVATEISRRMHDPFTVFFKERVVPRLGLTPEEGAVSQLYAATVADVEKVRAKYLVPQATVQAVCRHGLNVEMRKMIMKEADTIIATWMSSS